MDDPGGALARLKLSKPSLIPLDDRKRTPAEADALKQSSRARAPC